MNKQSGKKAVSSPRGGGMIPVPGPGRPKGSVNKFTSLKQSFLDAFINIGGTRELQRWAKGHKNQFYQMMTRLFPQEVEHSGEVKTGGELIVKVVFVKEPDSGNNDGNGDKKK